jgi:hypothetical protein
VLERVVGEHQAIAYADAISSGGGRHRHAAFVIERDGCFTLEHESPRN